MAKNVTRIFNFKQMEKPQNLKEKFSVNEVHILTKILEFFLLYDLPLLVSKGIPPFLMQWLLQI
jgi:hypothetical protein